MMEQLESCGRNCYLLKRRGKMKADVLIYLSDELKRSFVEEQSLQQLADAATLEGVVSPVIGMPDIHTGFGLPIGGVMAMDAEQGLVSAGAVGMDINCGVRLMRTNLEANKIDKPGLRKLIDAIEQRVPSGIGRRSRHAALVGKHFPEILQRGAPFLVDLGFGRNEDLERIEDGGSMAGADPSAVSERAVERGLQLSTIGGGNHFIEIGFIDKIFDRGAASAYGLEEGCLTVLVHTGSRGFGHQVCTDFTSVMQQAALKYRLEIPSKGLASVPIASPEGERYLAAMACAINFAFCNRQWITDDIRRAFSSVFGGDDRNYDLGLVYDVAHNTARFETVGSRKLLIHRKGATRALPPGHSSNPPVYKNFGHPILIPGSMGSASFVIRAEPGVDKIYNSVNHGAGRLLSRSAAKKKISVDQLKERLGPVIVSGRSYKAYLDEAPQAYKDIESVIDTFTEIGLCRRVARLIPLAVIKGEGSD